MHRDQATMEKEILKAYFGKKFVEIEQAINYKPPEGIQENQSHIFLENQLISNGNTSISVNKDGWSEDIFSKIKLTKMFGSRNRNIKILCHTKEGNESKDYELYFKETESRGSSSYSLENVKVWDESKVPKNSDIKLADSEKIINIVITKANEINKIEND